MNASARDYTIPVSLQAGQISPNDYTGKSDFISAK